MRISLRSWLFTVLLVVTGLAITHAQLTPVATAQGTPRVYSECDYTVTFSRSDHGPQAYYSLSLHGTPNDSFRFQGCSPALSEGRRCVSQYGIAQGARLLVNSRGEVVAEGNCCNSVTNTVVSTQAQCHERLAPATPLR